MGIGVIGVQGLGLRKEYLCYFFLGGSSYNYGIMGPKPYILTIKAPISGPCGGFGVGFSLRY